jgi:uncharacterized protein (TIGR03437 family)
MMAAVLCGPAVFAQSNFTTVSAGNWGPIVAPDSIAAGFGSNLATQTFSAFSVPLPGQLAGVSVQVSDSTQASGAAGLFMVSQGQINLEIPATAALGAGTATVTSGSGAKSTGGVLISNIAPAIFAANGNGMGVAAAEVFYYPASGNPSFVYTFAGGSSGYGTSPISLAASNGQAFLLLYGTGIRRHSPNPVQATIGGVKVPVTYAGPVSGEVGLDQINLGPLPQSLAGTGKGDVNISLLFDGVPANTVTVNFQ